MSGPEHRCPSCRITVLSRYNPDPLCGPCLRAARTTGAEVPAWLWDLGPMREALARLVFATVVAILRGAAGLSQLDLAQLVDGWSQTTVSRIESGRRQNRSTGGGWRGTCSARASGGAWSLRAEGRRWWPSGTMAGRSPPGRRCSSGPRIESGAGSNRGSRMFIRTG
jgi:hypothetical protein